MPFSTGLSILSTPLNNRLIKDVSPSAKATVRVMDFLLGMSLSWLSPNLIRSLTQSAEVEERRRPSNTTASSGKRKASSPADESDDGLQRAVKKLIRQAQLEADSPTNASSSGGGQSGTPGTGEKPSISRSSSKERPVFDAYPMPQAQGQGQASANTAVATNAAQRDPIGTGPQPSGAATGEMPSTRIQAGNQNQIQKQNQMFAPPNPVAPGQNLGQGQAFGRPVNPFDAQYQSNVLFASADPSNSNPFDPNSNFNLNFNFQPSPSAYNFPSDPHGSLDFFPNQGQALDPAVESMLASYFPPPQTQEQGQSQIAAGGVGAEDFLSRVFSFGWNDPAAGGEQGQIQAQAQAQGQQGNGNGNGNMGVGPEGWGAGGGWMG